MFYDGVFWGLGVGLGAGFTAYSILSVVRFFKLIAGR